MSRKRVVIALAAAVAVGAAIGLPLGLLTGPDEARGQDPRGTIRSLCVTPSEYRETALAAIGADLRANVAVVRDCEATTPRAARPGFNPDSPGLTSDNIFLEPLETSEFPRNSHVTIVVVEAGSELLRAVASRDFIIESQYTCIYDNCVPSGYEVYVTPEELGTPRLDELVARTTGYPRGAPAEGK